MTSAVAMAQTLGLNRDPSTWPIPTWEIQIRRRLAWATFTQDKWLALNFGRSSHINADDWEVSPLTSFDFEEPDRPIAAHFLHLCSLTDIVTDILSQLFSIRATRRLQSDLEGTINVAQPLRVRLTEWHQKLPPNLRLNLNPTPVASPQQPITASQSPLDGNGSLHLAFITAKIELFRAMLRPRVTHSSSASAVQALRSGALAVGREVLDFLNGLGPKEVEAFWASCKCLSNLTIDLRPELFY